LEEFIQLKTNEPDVINKDKFIHIKVNYLSSCFGAALPLLNQCIGKNGLSIRDELSKIDSDEVLFLLESKKLNDFTLPIPKELFKMVNFIL
jgi:hypothetical protein